MYIGNMYVNWFGSLHFIVEISTIFLQLRYFARIYELPLLFKISSILSIITYLFTRVLLTPIVIYINYTGYLNDVFCNGSITTLLIVEIFLVFFNTFYFFVMISSGSNFYILKSSKIIQNNQRII